MEQRTPIRELDDRPNGTERSAEQIVALSLEFASRLAALESLEEIHFALTNDLRTLVDYDRCFLITHLGGHTGLVAATHQPILDRKSELQNLVTGISGSVRELDKPVVLHKDSASQAGADEHLDENVRADFLTYMNASEATVLCCIPLLYNKSVVGHLLMEYFGEHVPDKTSMMALMKIAPVFAAALTGRWLLEEKPKLVRTAFPSSGKRMYGPNVFTPRRIIAALCLVILAALLFLVPFSYTVGGEAAVIPEEKQYAFCKIGGLIDSVAVRQGSMVTKGQILAKLDATELDHQIRREQRQFEILSRDMALLQSRAIDDPSTLARIQLIELKRKNVAAELAYLKWQSRFLEIKAPVEGIVVTADVDTLAGKKLNPGEPFCEIAQSDLLCAVVYVPDERIGTVKKGQDVDLYLNTNPRVAYKLTVDRIAPRAEVKTRLGNVYEVRALFRKQPTSLRVGMKGIGKIDTGTANLWTMVTRRLSTRLNQLALYF